MMVYQKFIYQNFRLFQLLQIICTVRNKKRELQKELEEYRVYEQKLDQLLEQMMKNGVSFLWRMN